MLARRWQITGTTIATQACQAGLLVYGFSVLALPLEEAFGTTRAEVMIATTCLSLVSSFMAPVAGWLVDRRSVRKLMLIGALCIGLGLVALSQAQAIWHVWLAYALILPWGNLLLGQITSATLITRWFDRQRGRAMGISTLGTSLGGFAFPAILFSAMATFGWRGGVAAVGIGAMAVLIPLIWFTVRDQPEDPLPDADDTGNAETAAPGLSSWQILGRPAFWIITFAKGIKLATYFGLINNLGGYAQDLDVDAAYVAVLVSLLSVTSAIGKLVFGAMAERVSPRTLFIVSLAMTIASFALLLLAANLPSLIVACLLLGISTGGLFPLWSLITAQYFGRAAFGRALGLMNLAMVPLTASAPLIAGYAHDRTGNYDSVIGGSMVVLAIAIALMFALQPPRPKDRGA